MRQRPHRAHYHNCVNIVRTFINYTLLFIGEIIVMCRSSYVMCVFVDDLQLTVFIRLHLTCVWVVF